MTPEHEVHRRVLVVEDDADGRDSLRALLETWGHAVDVAQDGEEGIRLALDRRPEVVLMDMGLPDMDGFEVARRIRAGRNGHAPFVIAVTGWTGPQDRKCARDIGIDVYLLKPTDPDELQALLAGPRERGAADDALSATHRDLSALVHEQRAQCDELATRSRDAREAAQRASDRAAEAQSGFGALDRPPLRRRAG